MVADYHGDSGNFDTLDTVGFGLRPDCRQNVANRLEIYCLRSVVGHVCR